MCCKVSQNGVQNNLFIGRRAVLGEHTENGVLIRTCTTIFSQVTVLICALECCSLVVCKTICSQEAAVVLWKTKLGHRPLK